MADDLGVSKSAENGPPWIFGLRPGYAYETWCAAIASILLGYYDDIKSGAKTLDAEHGLGIPPSWYWYIARSDESFGQGVFYCDTHHVDWEPTEWGVSPFDTGGLWHRHIKTQDDKTDAELRILFHNNNTPLYMWPKYYRVHLSENYLTVADYVVGIPPKAGTEGIICTHPPNHPRAWTWEARVERKSLEGRMNIVRLYCTSEDEREFGNWVETYSPYDLPTRKAVLGKFLSLLRPCTDFAHLSLAVGRDLLATLSLWVKQP